MKITKKNTKGLKREFNIVISAKEIEDKINEKLSEIALTARIPGFRPGKIPTSILKNRVGNEVRGEVLQTSIDEATKKAIQDENLQNLDYFKFFLLAYLIDMICELKFI